MTHLFRSRAALAACLVLLAACSGGGEARRAAAADPAAAAVLMQPDCYTVDLFQQPRYVSPGSDVPATHGAYLGHWGGGAWNGLVCHDLWVLNVDAAGRVLMIDAHGPGFRADATVFERVGRIDENGRLKVRKGRAQVEYQLVDGELRGTRTVGGQTIRIRMNRRGGPGA